MITIVRWKFILESLTVKLRCKVMTIDMRIESEEFNRYLVKFSGIWPKKTTDLEIFFDSVEEISVNLPWIIFSFKSLRWEDRTCLLYFAKKKNSLKNLWFISYGQWGMILKLPQKCFPRGSLWDLNWYYFAYLHSNWRFWGLVVRNIENKIVNLSKMCVLLFLDSLYRFSV